MQRSIAVSRIMSKHLDRLLFVQGGICFFCKQPLCKSEASVEHLLATANGGGNQDSNCVACCKSVNTILGNMSLKEKFQVVLNQQGKFVCPNNIAAAMTPPSPASSPPAVSPAPAPAPAPAKKTVADIDMTAIVANLVNRGTSRPNSIKSLSNTIMTLLPKGAGEKQVQAAIKQLVSSKKITLDGEKVVYSL